MRLIKQNIERDGSGTVTLFPEDPEDMVGPRPQAPNFMLMRFYTVVHVQSHSSQ